MSEIVDPAIRLAPGHVFAVAPPPKDLTYGFIGHGVDMVPHVWPHAQCVFTSQTDVVVPPTQSGSPSPGPYRLGLPKFIDPEKRMRLQFPWFLQR